MKAGALLATAIAACAWPALLAQAPVPVLEEVIPPALEPGAKVQVRLSGKNLAGAQGLLFSHAGFSARPSSTAEPTETKETKAPEGTLWEVAIDAAVPPGFHDLRVYTEHGVSAPRALQVSRLAVRQDSDPKGGQPLEAEPGWRYFGWVEAGDVERFRLRAPRRERLVIECFAERIDSRLDGTLEVFDAQGRRLAFSADRFGLDPAVAVDVEEGAEYLIELWDFTYGGKYPYLLSIAAEPRLLYAVPPALPPEGGTRVAFAGWNLPGSRALEGAGEPLEVLEATVGPLPPVELDRFTAYRSTRSLLLAGALEARPPGLECEPLILARAIAPPRLEEEPNDSAAQAMSIAVPAEVTGRFDTPRDRDWYRFEAAKGKRYEIEVLSAMLGAPCDPLLLIARREMRKEGGREVESVRDILFLDERQSALPREEAVRRKLVAADRDPLALWTAPEDGEYLLQVRNRNGRSGSDALYRLRLREALPDFELYVIHSDNYSGEGATVPRGGSQAYDVLVERRGGFEGAVEVAAEGLPEGVSCPPVFCGPDESFVPLVFSASAEAPEWTGNVHVAGTARWDGPPLSRLAASAVTVYGGRETRHPLQYVHSRFAPSLPLAVRGPAAFAVKLDSAERLVAPGAKVSIPLEVARAAEFKEGIQLAFQGLNQKGFPNNDNGERPARMTLAADKRAQDVELTIPNNKPYGDYSFVVFASAQVEYLEDAANPASKKRKSRTTYASNPVNIRVGPPLSLRLTEAAAALVPAGGSLELPFEVRRLEGVDEPVDVTLELPRGATGFKTQAVKLEKGQSEGKLVLESEIDAPAGSFQGFSLKARLQFAGRRFEESVELEAIERIAPLAVAAGELPAAACRGMALAVPFRLELAPSVTGKVSVALELPQGLTGIDSRRLDLEPGVAAGELPLAIAGAPSGEIRGLALAASIEKGGKRFTARALLPALAIEPAFAVVEAAQARVGALRLEIARHPALRGEEDLPLSVTLVTASGAEAAAECRFASGEERCAALVDCSSLPSGREIHPLRVRLAAGRPPAAFREEFLLEIESPHREIETHFALPRRSKGD
jgi:hypothetical protein